MSYGVRLIASRHVELCDECGFDAREVTRLVPAVVEALAALDAQRHRPRFHDRPGEGVWSGAEYATHTVGIANVLLDLVETSVGLGSTEPATDLAHAAERVEHVAARLGADAWAAPVDMGEGLVIPVSAVLAHLLHDTLHHVWDVRRGLARMALLEEHEVFTSRR